MKFRTELKIPPFDVPIRLSDRILTLGSCFADEVGARLREHKFSICCNPTGPLFNPLSLHHLLQRALDRRYHTEQELMCNEREEYFLFDHSTRLTSLAPKQLLSEANTLLDTLGEAFTASRHVLLTFGTAWVYRLTDGGTVVANCHKQPKERFTRERLSVEAIVACWKPLFEANPDKYFTLTVSPIRHLGDGLEQNALSKAILRVACAELTEQCPNVRYFPAYELLMDDLRDYRFYAEDLCHPSLQGAEYIFERFMDAAVDPHDRAEAEEAARLCNFLHHRPLHPKSIAYRSECATMIARMEAFSARTKIDFSAEITRLKSNL